MKVIAALGLLVIVNAAISYRNARAIRQTEAEADRLSVYLLARAGYAPGKAMDYWRRFQRHQYW